jgi:ubiquinone/menaquinone biosynthesis C-methylase UbiE
MSLASSFDSTAGTWDRLYDEGDARGFEYVQRMKAVQALAFSRLPPQSRVLEVGCGAGHNAKAFAEAGHHVTCADISQEMLERARANLAGRDAAFVHGPAHEVPAAAGPFALILALGVMDYVQDLQGTLDHMRTLLVPGGRVVLTYSNATSPAERVEAPLKRVVARGVSMVSGAASAKRVAELSGSTTPRSLSDIRQAYRAADLQVLEEQAVGFGVRAGGVWWPPKRVVRVLDSLLSTSSAGHLARTWIVVGQRPA